MKTKPTSRPRIQIIRGLPGSGKTTLALQKFSHLLRLETDMYFSRRGEYVFTMPLNKKAVNWFARQVKTCCKAGMDFVVTGVFAAHTERLYGVVATALENGYDVYIKTLRGNYGNIHDVPKEHFDAMKRAFRTDKYLRKIYRGLRTQVHFGLMPPDWRKDVSKGREKR